MTTKGTSMPIPDPPVGPLSSGEIPRPLFPSNFQRLAFHRDWPNTWTHIVAGKFSNAPYDGLLFYEQSNGYAEFDEQSSFGEYGTSLTVVGGETDKVQKSPDPCKPNSPDGFEQLAEVLDRDGSGRVACTMGTFTHGKGQVFTAATLNWSLGLSQDGVSWNAIDQITRNVFERLGGADRNAGQANVVGFNADGSMNLQIIHSGWNTTWDMIIAGDFVGNGRQQILLYDRSDN